jgi:hypothetical protein
MLEAELQKWTEQYGIVTTFNYMVYGEITDEYTGLLNRGLKLHLLVENEVCPIMMLVKEIEEVEATVLNTFQGTNLCIAFPENKKHLEEYITGVVSDCLNYLRLKNDFLGLRLVESNV